MRKRGGGGGGLRIWKGWGCSSSRLGCKFRILVWLRVFWAKRHSVQAWRSRLGLHAKKYKNIYLICIFLIRFICSIHIIQVSSFVCVFTWSLLGVKKAWATPRSVSFRGLIQNFRRASPPISNVESPSPRCLYIYICFKHGWIDPSKDIFLV